MKNTVFIKILSAVFFVFILLTTSLIYTIAFNSIVISHYGGLSYSFTYLLPIISFGLGIAFIVHPALSVLNTKPKIVKYIFIFLLASVSCFVYEAVPFLITYGCYHKSVFVIFKSSYFYIYLSSVILQILFLGIAIPKGSPKIIIRKTVFKLLFFQTFVMLVMLLSNFKSINSDYQRRTNKPNYRKGNSKILRVVVGEKCGVLPCIKDGKSIIEIPKNGIVIIKGKDAYTNTSQIFFTNEKNEKQKLFLFDTWGKDDKHANEYEKKHHVKGAIWGGQHYILGKESDGSYSSEAPTAIEYFDFIIYSTNFSYVEDNKKKMELLTKKLVKECRGN